MNRLIVASILILPMIAYSADESKLYGVWNGNTPTAQISYNLVTIKEGSISWEGNNKYNPLCEAKFDLVEKYSGETYEGKHSPPKKDHVFDVFKLKIASEGCSAGGFGYILFAIPANHPNENGFSYADVVMFSQENKALAWLSFHKQVSENLK